MFLTEGLNNLILIDIFIIDILSYLVQNFNPINLERKLDIQKVRQMVKFLWDECIPHDFVCYIYQQSTYNEISKPNLTYQNANSIVKQFVFEDPNRINLLKYKIEEKFSLIHYIYSMLFSKIYNRTNILKFKIKTILISIFKLGKVEKLVERLLQKF